MTRDECSEEKRVELKIKMSMSGQDAVVRCRERCSGLSDGVMDAEVNVGVVKDVREGVLEEVQRPRMMRCYHVNVRRVDAGGENRAEGDDGIRDGSHGLEAEEVDHSHIARARHEQRVECNGH